MQSIDKFHRQNGIGGEFPKDLRHIQRRILAKETTELVHRATFAGKIQLTTNRSGKVIDQTDRIKNPRLGNMSVQQNGQFVH